MYSEHNSWIFAKINLNNTFLCIAKYQIHNTYVAGNEILTSNISTYFNRRSELDFDTSTEYQTKDLSDSNQYTSSWCFLAISDANWEAPVRPRMINTAIRQKMTALIPTMEANLSKVFIWNVWGQCLFHFQLNCYLGITYSILTNSFCQLSF